MGEYNTNIRGKTREQRFGFTCGDDENVCTKRFKLSIWTMKQICVVWSNRKQILSIHYILLCSIKAFGTIT